MPAIDPDLANGPILAITNTTHQQALTKAETVHYQNADRIQADLQAAFGQSMSYDTVKRLKRTIIPIVDYGEAQSLIKTQ